MKPNNFAMKEWHLEHVEKTIVRFSKGLSPDASAYEKRNHKKYGTLSYCIKQIEYDMKHGVDKAQVMEVMRRIRLDKKYVELRKDMESAARLVSLENMLLADAQKIQEAHAWYNNAHKERSKSWVF